MKFCKSSKFFLAIVFGLVFSYSTGANAAMSQQSLQQTFQQEDLGTAVEVALAFGTSVDAIIKQALQTEGVNPQQLLLALLQSGANSQDLTRAAKDNGISDLIIVASIKDFKSEKSDAQAYTAPEDTAPNVIPGPGSLGSGSGSPANEPFVKLPFVSPSTL
jgi:hypothetical protein